MPRCQIESCKRAVARRTKLKTQIQNLITIAKRTGNVQAKRKAIELGKQWKALDPQKLLVCSGCYIGVKGVLELPSVPTHKPTLRPGVSRADLQRICRDCEEARRALRNLKLYTLGERNWTRQRNSCINCLKYCRGERCRDYEKVRARLVELIVKSVKVPRRRLR